jgi:general secretion pathway protein A
MYQEFYGLSLPPFRVPPDPEFLYLSPSHKEALAAIVNGIDERKGLIVVLGDVGLGKTTLLRFYLDRLTAKGLTAAYIFNANIAFTALLETILRELRIEHAPGDVRGMVARLHEAFIEEHRQGRIVVLIVDEAQNTPIETLESLQVLSNLETSSDKLLQIVLVGQPEFAATLDRHELRQIRQRVAVRATLVPFTDRESLEYIEHRLNRAGGSSASVFTPGALRGIVKHAGGVPRMINTLCDNALVAGAGDRKKPVDARIVRDVIAGLTGQVRVRRQAWWWALPGAVVAAGALFLASPYRDLLVPSPETPVQVPALPPGPARVLPDPAGGEAWRRHLEEKVVLPPPEPSAVAAPTPDTSTESVVATVVVKEGDTLGRLAIDVYGFTNVRLLQRIQEANPRIKDPNRLLVGSTIRFPAIPEEGADRPPLAP